MTNHRLFAETALLPEGWRSRVTFEIDGAGDIAEVTADSEPNGAERCAGPVVPGMPNLHSHAFQRAMAGLAERAGPSGDSFWTWREVMYGFVRKLTPEQIEAIARQLYIEMLKAGYTAVGEFHYVHHTPGGQPYDNLAELSERVIAAARDAGIGITHLPVLYGYGGFGGVAAGEGQRRFINDPDRFLKIVESVASSHAEDANVAVGIAPHSLRAVTPETLEAAVDGVTRLNETAPIHIHIAEQRKEVMDCEAWSGQRPVEWLLSHAEVGKRWCLVHATHMTTGETEKLAALGAVAGLCPTTEANLGDGIFPAIAFLERGGRFGIGSDSHISISPVEELRWLEYGQRLSHLSRNALAKGEGDSVGASLYRHGLAGGAQALGRRIGTLAKGMRADLVILDNGLPTLFGREGDRLLDSAIFAGNVNPVRDVMVGGQWRVRDGRHEGEVAALSAYRAAIRDLSE